MARGELEKKEDMSKKKKKEKEGVWIGFNWAELFGEGTRVPLQHVGLLWNPLLYLERSL